MKRVKQFFTRCIDEEEDDGTIDEEDNITSFHTTSNNQQNTEENPHLLSNFAGFHRDVPRIMNRGNGHYRIKRKNQHSLRSRVLHLTSIYHILINFSWWKLLLLLILFYLTLHITFALLYFAAGNDTIGGLNPELQDKPYSGESFIYCFFFSVQTMFTIGYGGLYPKSYYANSLVVLQSFLGLFIDVFVVTLSVAKFSRPTKLRKSILFSKVGVINHLGYFNRASLYNELTTRSSFDSNVPELPEEIPMYFVFRFANNRKTQFCSTKLRMVFIEWMKESQLHEHKRKTMESIEKIEEKNKNLKKRKKGGIVSDLITSNVNHNNFGILSSLGESPNNVYYLQSMDIPNDNKENNNLTNNNLNNPNNNGILDSNIVYDETTPLHSFWGRDEIIEPLYPLVTEMYFQVNHQNGKTMDIDFSTPLMGLPFTVVHPITKDSPLYTYLRNPERKNNIEIVVCLDAIDEATSGQIQARYSYTVNDLILDNEFSPCVYRKGKELIVDYDKLSDVRPIL
ncbi:hypothetical protein ABK040_005940 [Willaertia magna]